ncbi:MAG: DNA recombination protein RmuC [Porticoccaceae bacterium]|jgi:DNA recombination protein RmuC|nr:DNA recombination protein RmuC [Porticoccaceae bacterium]
MTEPMILLAIGIGALVLIAISVLITKMLVSQRCEITAAAERQELEKEISTLTALLSEEQKRLKDFQEQDADRSKLLQGEFERLANRIFEEKQTRFAKESKDNIDSTLKPLREQVEGFRKRVEEVHNADIADRNRLKGQIEELQKQASQIGTDAVGLANALKGDSKMQGNWGEVVLERILEQSGLVKGSEYQTQESFKDEAGNRAIPDVVVKLPEGRVMVIDSKVSLTHYQAYVNEEKEDKKKDLLKQHIGSLANHYKSLDKKGYQHLEALDTLDFVFMFVPVEPAYLLALKESPDIFDDAFSKGVVMVSHTTLMPMLRTVQSLWRTEKQSRNAQEIADTAGKLHDQFVFLLQDLDEVGKHMEKTDEAYQSARKRISGGRGNLLGWVSKLDTLGAKAKKELPGSAKNLLDKDESDGSA